MLLRSASGPRLHGRLSSNVRQRRNTNTPSSEALAVSRTQATSQARWTADGPSESQRAKTLLPFLGPVSEAPRLPQTGLNSEMSQGCGTSLQSVPAARPSAGSSPKSARRATSSAAPARQQRTLDQLAFQAKQCHGSRARVVELAFVSVPCQHEPMSWLCRSILAASVPARRALPNPSLERTSTGWARYARWSFSASRAQPVASAQLKR
jgi:hypothetical protein